MQKKINDHYKLICYLALGAYEGNLEALCASKALLIIDILCKSGRDIVKRQDTVSLTEKLCKFY